MTLREYIETEIIPRYDAFDGAHRRDHVGYVIDESLKLAEHYGLDRDMVYTVAAYHDTGLAVDRKTHHLESGRILRSDELLKRWFSPEQIEIMAQAVEDHRASSNSEPRSIYGKIVAEADRQIDSLTIIRRTISYGLSHYPELDREGHWLRTLEHIREKYADGGYLKLWIPESDNARKLEELRELIRRPALLREIFDREFPQSAGIYGWNRQSSHKIPTHQGTTLRNAPAEYCAESKSQRAEGQQGSVFIMRDAAPNFVNSQNMHNFELTFQNVFLAMEYLSKQRYDEIQTELVRWQRLVSLPNEF